MPVGIDKLILKVVTQAHSFWRCAGRFWMSYIHIHPVLGSCCAIAKSLQRYREYGHVPAIRQAVSSRLSAIGLRLTAWTPHTCLAMGISGHPIGDLFQMSGWPNSLDLYTPVGLHRVRLAARYMCARRVRGTRHDSEGIRRVCLEASSHPAWRRFMSSLDERQRFLLHTFRCGASRTPTRFVHDGGEPPTCQHCHHP